MNFEFHLHAVTSAKSVLLHVHPDHDLTARPGMGLTAELLVEETKKVNSIDEMGTTLARYYPYTCSYLWSLWQRFAYR